MNTVTASFNTIITRQITEISQRPNCRSKKRPKCPSEGKH